MAIPYSSGWYAQQRANSGGSSSSSSSSSQSSTYRELITTGGGQSGEPYRIIGYRIVDRSGNPVSESSGGGSYSNITNQSENYETIQKQRQEIEENRQIMTQVKKEYAQQQSQLIGQVLTQKVQAQRAGLPPPEYVQAKDSIEIIKSSNAPPIMLFKRGQVETKQKFNASLNFDSSPVVERRKSPEETVDRWGSFTYTDKKTYQRIPAGTISVAPSNEFNLPRSQSPYEGSNLAQKYLIFRELKKSDTQYSRFPGASDLVLSMPVGATKFFYDYSIFNVSGRSLSFKIPGQQTVKGAANLINNPVSVVESLSTPRGMGEFVGSVAASSTFFYVGGKAVNWYQKGQTIPPRGKLQAKSEIYTEYPKNPSFNRDYGEYTLVTDKFNTKIPSYRYNLYSTKETAPYFSEFVVSGKNYKFSSYQDLSGADFNVYSVVNKKFLGRQYTTVIKTDASGLSSYAVYKNSFLKGQKLLRTGEFSGVNEFVPKDARVTFNQKVSIYESNQYQGFGQLKEAVKKIEVTDYFKSRDSSLVDFKFTSRSKIVEQRMVSSKNPFYLKQGYTVVDDAGNVKFKTTYLDVKTPKFKFVESTPPATQEFRSVQGGRFQEMIEPYYTTVQRSFVETKGYGTVTYRDYTRFQKMFRDRSASVGIGRFDADLLKKYEYTPVGITTKVNNPTITQPALNLIQGTRIGIVPLFIIPTRSDVYSKSEYVSISRPVVSPAEVNIFKPVVKPVVDIVQETEITPIS